MFDLHFRSLDYRHWMDWASNALDGVAEVLRGKKKAPLLLKEGWQPLRLTGWLIDREVGVPASRLIYHPDLEDSAAPSFRRREFISSYLIPFFANCSFNASAT